MGNSSEKKTNSLLDQQRSKQEQAAAGITKTASDRSNRAYDDSEGRIKGLTSRYTDYADTGGFGEKDFDAFRSSFGGGGGEGYYSGGGSTVADELTKTGGIDESKFADALAGYKDFASSGGGVDAEGIRYRSNRVIPSFYKNLENEQSRRKLVNPYSPSFDAESASMARQAGQQTQENIRDTETGISEMITRGRQFGIKGLGDLNTNIQGMIQSGKISGGQQQISNEGLSQGAAGLRESAAARRQAGEESILTMKQRGKLSGLSGLEGLYQTQNSNAGNYFDREAGSSRGSGQDALENIRSRQNTTPWWKTVLQAGSAAAGSYFGAGGGK